MITPLSSKEFNLLPVYVYMAQSYKHQNVISRTAYDTLMYTQISLCRKGTGIFTDNNNKKYTIQPGDLFYFRPGYSHSYTPESYPWSVDFILLGGKFADELLNLLEFSKYGVIHTSELFPEYEAAFAQIIKTYKSGSPTAHSQNSRQLVSLLYQLSRHLDKTSHKSSTRDTVIATQCMKYIELNYAKDFSISEIAKSMNTSATKLIEAFHKEYDTTPQKFLTSVRLNKAKSYLVHNKLAKLSEIANACGFASTNYFCTVFKKHIGQTPEEYRRSNIYDYN